MRKRQKTLKKRTSTSHKASRGSRLVGVTGLEPAASWSRTKRTTKLCHTPFRYCISILYPFCRFGKCFSLLLKFFLFCSLYIRKNLLLLRRIFFFMRFVLIFIALLLIIVLSYSDGENMSYSEIDKKTKLHELSTVKKTIAVIGGKGGVGKSTVTSMLAVTMQRRGLNTAILDADITGASVPHAFGLKGTLDGTSEGVFPMFSP